MKNFYILIIACLLFGCGSSREIGSERVVEKSGSKPDWINSISRDAGDFVYVRGIFTGATYQSDGEKASVHNAANELRQLAGSYISTLEGSSDVGDPRNKAGMGDALKSATVITSDPQLFFNNFKPELYSEKIEKITNSGVEYSYNCYVLVKIAKADYNQILEKILKGGIKEAQEMNHREAKEFLEDAFQKHMEKMKK
jgi:hypothetical protein